MDDIWPAPQQPSLDFMQGIGEWMAKFDKQQDMENTLPLVMEYILKLASMGCASSDKHSTTMYCKSLWIHAIQRDATNKGLCKQTYL